MFDSCCSSPHRSDALRRRWAALVAVLCALLSLVSRSGAADRTTAESLFQQGKEALSRGELAQACRLFEASLKAERAVGALLNLALCHQQQGKTATAWAEFRKAARMAEHVGQPERAQGAREYAVALEPSLSMLTIAVEGKTAGLAVARNGQPVDSSTFGVPIAVDPGEYTVTATAPGHDAWSTTVSVGPKADRQTVTVPLLPAMDTAEPSAEPDAEPPSPVLVTGLVVGGVGVAALSVGIVLGAVAVDETGDLDEACPSRSNCSAEVLAQRDTVETKADVATAAIVGGSAAVAAGLLMVLLAPSADRSEATAQRTARLEPRVGPSSVGLALEAHF